MDTAAAPTTAPEAPVLTGRTYRRHAWIAGALVVLLLAAGLIWWLRHPEPAFEGGYGLDWDEVAVDDTVWTALSERSVRSPDDRVITIDRIEPRVARDGTEARIEYFVCTFDAAYGEAEGVGGFGYGGDTAEAERQCTSLAPAVGTTLALGGAPVQQLVVAITPHRPGVLVVRDHEVTWSDGWRSRTETIDVRLRIPAVAR